MKAAAKAEAERKAAEVARKAAEEEAKRPQLMTGFREKGDPKTWGGSETVVTMKKGDEDGLAGCLIDLNVLQEILYKRPSGLKG